MQPKFYFNGCSFTEGDELQNKLESRYSKLVCDQANAIELNESKNGSSNHRILRRFVEDINKDNFDFVFIMWSSFDRFEHFSDHVKQDKGYASITISNLFPDLESKENRIERVRMRANALTVYQHKESVKQTLTNYMLDVRTRAHQVSEFLNMVLIVQTICKSKKIPYMMSNFDYKQTIEVIDTVLEDFKKIKHQHKGYSWLLESYNLIDWNAWLNDRKFSFLQFAQEKNFSIGINGHPLELAHDGFSKQIYKSYKRLTKQQGD